MQLLYQSDSFVVVRVELPATAGETARGGYEIVDKRARHNTWIDGPLADGFRRGVRELVERGTEPEALDDFIAGYTLLAQQPLVLH